MSNLTVNEMFLDEPSGKPSAPSITKVKTDKKSSNRKYCVKIMTEQELQQYLKAHYPKENEGCEWKEFKNLKNDFNGKEKDDVRKEPTASGKRQKRAFCDA